MENYHRQCSYGKARFAPENNLVLDLTNVEVPCTGTLRGMFQWDSNQCTGTELYGWAEWLENYTKNVSSGVLAVL